MRSKEKEGEERELLFTTEQLAQFQTDLDVLDQLLHNRLDSLSSAEDEIPIIDLAHIELQVANADSPYGQLVERLNLTVGERVLLMTALLPHLKPSVLTDALSSNSNALDLKHKAFGGFIERSTLQFMPTLQTALYLAAGKNTEGVPQKEWRMNMRSPLFREQILMLEPLSSTENKHNILHHALLIEPDYLEFLRTGEVPKPDFGSDFPARLLESNLSWDDLVLPPVTENEIRDAMMWLAHGEELCAADNRINPSFPCLFYGPPGTGKTLTATLIGQHYNRPVFRVDLSMVVSKYIGETEKNLEKLFSRADGKNWILFFDEADALFSKRTSISDSNDKWANNEVAYLLQRMETYKGMTILASNLVSNIDPAMRRRFQTMIHFPAPSKAERMRIWKTALPKGFSYDEKVDLGALCVQELTGANIATVLKMACLQALALEQRTLSQNILLRSIRKELKKQDRTML